MTHSRVVAGESMEAWRAVATPRVERLREAARQFTHAKARLAGDLSIFEVHGAAVAEEPLVVRKALGLALLLREMPVLIQDDELIVGSRTIFAPAEARSSPTFRTEEKMGTFYYPSYATAEEKARAQAAGLFEGYATNHTAAGYDRVLTLGFGGLRSFAEEKQQSASDPESRDFYRAVSVVARAASDFVCRYAFAAERLAADAGPARAGELREIAAVCAAVAEEPPKTFRQAVQLFWLTHVIVMAENYNLMAVGRLDQWLCPFYAADASAGRITVEEAQELVDCLFVKLNEQTDLTTDNGLNVVLGGLTPEGEDGTNDLSYLCLQGAEHLRLSHPQLNVRMHRGSPEGFLRRAAEVVRLGLGHPAFFNDEAVVPAMVAAGVSLPNARDYANDGCTEVFVGGKSDFYPVFAGVILLPPLIGALRRLEEFSTFAELLSAYLAALDEAIANRFAAADARDRAIPLISPVPFLSATLEGCLETGRDKTAGGARYSHTGAIGEALVETANSLAAVKLLVYEQQRLSPAELATALRSDYDGAEMLRQLLRNRGPKWGNDDDRVDLIAAEVGRHYCTEVLRYRNPRGGRYLPGFFQYHYVLLGSRMEATPDGRRKGEPLAPSLSPAPGTDRKGPTAIARSLSKIDHGLCPLGHSVDLSFHPGALADDEGIDKYVAFLRGFVDLGGMEMQGNTVGADVLRAAQREPENYRHLVVRVWGFNAYFVTLNPEYQEHIIARTEHRL